MAKKKFRRRPRGAGSYYKLSGNRRRPWIATITVGYNDDTGAQIQKPIGYFETELEAMNALYTYSARKENNQPVSVPEMNVTTKISFKDIFEKVKERELDPINHPSSYRSNVAAFKKMKALHNLDIREIKLYDIQPIFDENNKASHSTLNNMKILCNRIFNYAMKYEYLDKNPAIFLEVNSTSKTKKKNFFSKEQIKYLFKHDDEFINKTILIFIYTGMRVTELLTQEKKNVFLDKEYMIGGIKSDAGRDRIIPIHPAIYPYIEEFMRTEGDTLISENCDTTPYYWYRTQFDEKMEMMKWEYTPHCARHTFITLADEYKLQDHIVKLIVGHSESDLTKRVYTHVEPRRLVDEVKLIPKLC